MRRRRNEVSIELRKNKRDESLLKRRNVPHIDTLDDDDGGRAMCHTSLDLIVSNANSSEPDVQLTAVQGARYILSSFSCLFCLVFISLS